MASDPQERREVPTSTEVVNPAPPKPELVIITGMSGAGRSETIHTFEDLGYFCIDNLPPSLIPQLVDLTRLPGSRVRRLAIVCDVRGKEFFDELQGELKRLEDNEVPFHLLFLEASDEILIRRFKETRRKHPLGDEVGSVAEGIEAEREALASIRGRADLVIDTSDLRPKDLRQVLKDRFFSGNLASSLSISVTSFGFKYGLPTDADIVIDVRFLPNPYYVHELREHTGLETAVCDFVLQREDTGEFLRKWFDLLSTLVPGYLMEGKSHLTIALGCTGGMHRSVVLAEETASFLRGLGYSVAANHRDIGKDRERA